MDESKKIFQNINLIDNLIVVLGTLDNKKCNKQKWLKHKRRNNLYSKGIGFIYKHQNNKYFITSSHVIRNTKKVYGIKIKENKIDFYKFELSILVNSIEFDIAILKANDKQLINNLFKQPFSFSNIEKKVPKVNNKIKIIAIDTINNINECFRIKISNWNVNNISFQKVISNSIPESLIINVLSRNFFDNNIINYSGLSGTPCFDINDKIIGFISMTDSDQNIFQDVNIDLLPSINIFRVIKEFTRTNMYNGICDFCYKIEDNKIINNYNIKKNKLLKDDVIESINNNIVRDGYIYYSKIDYKIPLRTYFMMEYYNDQQVNIIVSRNNRKKKVNQKTFSVNDYYKIPLSCKNTKYFVYDDMVFIQITEDIIEYYSEKGFRIIGPFLDSFETIFNHKKNKSIIILIDLLSKNNKLIDKIDSPLFTRSYKNKNSLIKYTPTLKKLNGKYIKDLNDLKKKIKNKNNLFDFEIETNKIISINL